MTLGTFCSGIGSPELAATNLGWRCAWASEIEPFPSAVLAHHYPHTPNLGDMTKLHGGDLERVDVVCAGTPCFPKGHLVLTARGLVDISEVRIGDSVLTHKSRYRKVVRVGSKISKVYRMRGQGAVIYATAEHPFYSRSVSRKWVNEIRNWSRSFGDAEWTNAIDMKGKFWATPIHHERLPIPEIDLIGNEKIKPAFGRAFWWCVGAWLGDGWCRINKRRGYVIICANFDESDEVEDKLRLAGLHFSKSKERTTDRFQIASRAFARWLISNFGHGAEAKTLPAWAFGMEESDRRALLDGYQFADGSGSTNVASFTTISPKLAVGIRLIGVSLGYSVTLSRHTPNRIAVIEGRVVSERPQFAIKMNLTPRSSFVAGDHRYGLVRDVGKPTIEEVFNLEIEDDHSFTVSGIVVHNCQSFSVAGLRAGMADPRGNLALVLLGLVDAARPWWLVYENVPGLLSSNGGRDFGAFLGALGQLGYGFAYRTFDAQFVRVHGHEHAVPQRRRRVFVVGYLGDWRRAAAVLFERNSMSGNPAPGRTTGERVARSVAASLRSSGADTSRVGDTRGQDNVVAVPAVSPALKARDHKGPSSDGDGDGAPMIPMALAFKSGQSEAAGGTFVTEGFAPTLQSQNNGSTAVPCVAFTTKDCGGDALDDLSPTIRAGGFSNSHANGGIMPAVMTRYAVRRLMPIECEKLQGFPPGYTNVIYRNKPAADAPRYKAIGNSIANNVIRWIFERIQMVESLPSESPQ